MHFIFITQFGNKFTAWFGDKGIIKLWTTCQES